MGDCLALAQAQDGAAGGWRIVVSVIADVLARGLGLEWFGI